MPGLSNSKLERKLGKAQYLTEKLNAMPEESRILKLCDRFDNTKDLASCDKEFQLFYAFETEHILSSIVTGDSTTAATRQLISDIWSNISPFLPDKKQ